jgi:hypothetical protein
MKRIPVHPLLLALVPVASMYAAVPGSAMLAELARAAAAAVLVAAACLAVAWAVFRDGRKAALFTSVFLIVFLVVGATYRSLEDWQVAGLRLARRRYFVPAVYLAVAAFGFALYRTRRSLAVVTTLANVVMLGALIPPVISITRAQMVRSREQAAMPALAPVVAGAPAAQQRPDIYYFVFDRYGGEQTLRTFGVDPEPLYHYLEQRGFYVARASRANYIKTVLSLASSLNMALLDDVSRAYGTDSQNWDPVYTRLQRHRVGAFLRDQGYQYFHLGSWYWPTRTNVLATRNQNYYVEVPKPLVLLLDNVLFEPFQRWADSPLVDQRRQHWYRSVREIEDVLEIAPQPGPKFVFLHLLVPHQPYVFDRDGSYVPIDVENHRSRDRNYANQVLAANRMIRHLVDGILERSPAPPVIIVQGDEGPYPEGTERDGYEWRKASVDILQQRAGILNAYLLPNAPGVRLYPEISPVNSFRVVFNTYFGTALPLLPDRTFRHASDQAPYAFDDITDLVSQGRRETQVAHAR